MGATIMAGLSFEARRVVISVGVDSQTAIEVNIKAETAESLGATITDLAARLREMNNKLGEEDD